jgi:CubicO group peptidase (beta-lactamase class C family)
MKRPRHFKIAAALLLAAAALYVVPCLRGERTQKPSPGEPAVSGMDAKALARISERMREFVEDGQIAGAVTLVGRQGHVVHLEAVGYADVENKRPMRRDSLFAIASMTKPITATAVMILQDEGKLSVEEPVSKYLPEFKSASLKSGPPSREITIRDLLTHTSGVGGGQRTEQTLKATAEMIAHQPLRFEPGSKWQYSPGLNVCGRIIEVVSKKPYDAFLAERIFRPLGMVDTTFQPTPEQRERLARLYRPGPKAKSLELASHWLVDDAGQRAPNPSGGLFSTAADMARFYLMVLDGGELDGRRIVSKAAAGQMTRLQTDDLTTGFTPGNGWGLGWCIVRQPQGVTAMLSPGTFGHGGAFGTQGWVDPRRRMIFVLMIQRTGFGNSDGSEIRRAFQELAVQAIGER